MTFQWIPGVKALRFVLIQSWHWILIRAAWINIFKVNNRNTRTKCERQWRSSGVFIVNCEHISHLVLVNNVYELALKNVYQENKSTLKEFT